MDPTIELDLLRRLLDLHERRATSTADAPRRQATSVYTDAHHQQLEIDALLRGQPLIAGLSCELPATGGYVALDVGNVPVLLVRPPDGTVRAFLNACRHRGSAVACERGAVGATVTCPYHGWSYALDGSLHARPRAGAAFDGLGDDGLLELPCAEAAGVVVVGTAPGVDADAVGLLAGLATEIASHELDGYRFVGERTATYPFNWKLGFETFLESYHVFSLHRTTLAKQLASTPMLSEFVGRHGRGVVMGKDCPRLLDRPTGQWDRFGHATLVYWLLPNAVLSMPQSGHAELWTFVPAEGRPDRSTIRVRFFAAPAAPTDDGFWDRLITFTMEVVDAEDFGQQALIQRSVGSGLLESIVFGRNEPGLIHFHEQLDLALQVSTVSTPTRPVGRVSGPLNR